jgi:hypothetical protein
MGNGFTVFLIRLLKVRIYPYFLNALVRCEILKDFPPLAGVPHVCHVEFAGFWIFLPPTISLDTPRTGRG